MNFSCTAGDVAQFSIDVMGTAAGAWSDTNPPHITTSEKLITWDKVSVSLPGGYGALNYQSFSFDISNNLEAAYTLSQDNLFPVDIVPGLRSISGSLTVYNAPDFNGADAWDDYLATDTDSITFNIGDLSVTMKAVFHRVLPASSTGLVTSTVAFTGVGHQTGSPWEA